MQVRNPAPDGSPSREPTGIYRVMKGMYRIETLMPRFLLMGKKFGTAGERVRYRFRTERLQ